MYTYEYPVYQNYQKEPRQPSKTKRWGTTLLVSLLKCGKDFCNDTSIHGFNHIAAPGRLWIERFKGQVILTREFNNFYPSNAAKEVFTSIIAESGPRFLWICACGLAIWEALNVSLGQLQRYNESPTVVTLEKDFRSWEYSMPAITCCYLNRLDMDKLPAVIKKYWGIEVHDEKYAYYTRFVNAVASSDLFHLQKFEEFQDMETQVNMYQIALDVMPDLKIKLVPSEPGDWKWWPVMTEGGVCHVTNSLALADVAIIKPKPNETASSPVMCKNSANNCYVVLDNYALVEYYIHSPYDVVDFGQDEPSVAFLSLTRETELTIMESRCGRGVKELRPNRRGCLYTDEPVDEGRRVYSTNSCRLSCRSKIAMKLCGCVPFYYFYEGGPLCSPAGMWCLSSYTHNIRSNDDEKCPCAPQCVDSVFKEFDVKDQIWNRPPFLYRGSVKFTIQGPRTRYTREIVFHFQDLVVSFGGAAGLFLGASFISFIEILYFLLSRLFRVFVKKDKKNLSDQKTVAVKPISHTTAHETVRLKQLSAVLATQRKYEQNDINFMNPIYY